MPLNVSRFIDLVFWFFLVFVRASIVCGLVQGAGVYIVQNTMARGGGKKNGAGEKK